jgi:quercetin dioxygenase-like cupin family protein
MTESIWFTDSLIRIHVTPEDTNGAYALAEVLQPAGHVTPPHIHENDAESFFLMEGEITVHTKDGPIVVRPGQAGHIPAGVAHTVLVSAPSHFIEYVHACGRLAEREALPTLDGPPDIGPLLREAPAHGMTVLGPPGVLPADVVSEV